MTLNCSNAASDHATGFRDRAEDLATQQVSARGFLPSSNLRRTLRVVDVGRGDSRARSRNYREGLP